MELLFLGIFQKSSLKNYLARKAEISVEASSGSVYSNLFMIPRVWWGGATMVGEGANFLHKNMYKGKSLNNLLENQLPRKTLTLVNTSKDCVVLSLSESLGVGGPHWGGGF